MDSQNIDRLFREKMNGFEATPSTDSWSQIQLRIQQNQQQSYPLIRIVAVITLLVTSWVVWINKTSEAQSANVIINHPILPPQEKIDLSIAIPLPNTEKSESKPSAQKLLPNESYAKKSKKTLNMMVSNMEGPVKKGTAETILVDVDAMPKIQNIEKYAVKKKPKRMIKITYISSSRSTAAPIKKTIEKTTTLNKIIAFARKIDPGAMLADMKTAKDNLLNGGIKNRKRKSEPNP